EAKCSAFAAGIPNEILLSKADHRKAFAGDRGIRFEAISEAASRYAAVLFSEDEPVPAGATAITKAKRLVQPARFAFAQESLADRLVEGSPTAAWTGQTSRLAELLRRGE
ncbi:MAG: hypothetical protein ACXWQ6_10410, partial [Candidatus Limnocylindrales bacterium]